MLEALFGFSRTYKKSDFKKCGNSVIIYPNPHIEIPENLEIEDEVFIAESCYIDARGGVQLKKGAILASNVTIFSSNHNYDSPDQKIFPFDEKYHGKKVVVGEFSWIGRNAIIMNGVTIGKGCVIGAGSVVASDVEDFAIVAGNPAKTIKKRENQNIDSSSTSWIKSDVRNETIYKRYFVK
jgi:maltose O-acetyltransferase